MGAVSCAAAAPGGTPGQEDPQAALGEPHVERRAERLERLPDLGDHLVGGEAADPIQALVTVSNGYKLFQGVVTKSVDKGERGFSWSDVEIRGTKEFEDDAEIMQLLMRTDKEDLVADMKAAIDELESWELQSLSDPRNWTRIARPIDEARHMDRATHVFYLDEIVSVRSAPECGDACTQGAGRGERKRRSSIVRRGEAHIAARKRDARQRLCGRAPLGPRRSEEGEP